MQIVFMCPCYLYWLTISKYFSAVCRRVNPKFHKKLKQGMVTKFIRESNDSAERES